MLGLKLSRQTSGILLLQALSKHRWLILFSLGITVLYINTVLLGDHNKLLKHLENIAYDIRLNLTLPHQKHEQIVILDIDEKSLQELGRWPWPRDRLASVVDTLFNHYQVAVLAFDVVFAESDTDPGLDQLEQLAKQQLTDSNDFLENVSTLRQHINRDQQFADSLLDRPVILGYYFQNEFHMHSSLTTGQLPFPILPIQEAGLEQLPFIQNTGFGANIETLQNNALAAGYFDNTDNSTDGVIREIPLVSAYQGNLYESLALATVRTYLDQFFIEPVTTNDDNGLAIALEALRIGELTVPVNDKAMALIPYLGRQGSFNYYSISDVLQQRVPVAELKDKIIMVGTTSTGLQDLRTTPVQTIYPGVEVHANLVAGMLDQRIKYKPGYSLGITFIQLALIGLVLSLLLPFLSAVGSILVALIIGSALLMYNFYSWQQGLVLPIASSLLLIILLFTFHMAYGFITEARKKRLITRTFGQYVPPDVVAELSANPTLSDLSGQSRDMTVLFSDVRGFTSLSENLTPGELTEVMNAILTPITRIIYEHGGTIDKYMGDAVMAFWGAPLDNPQHAKAALQAAVEMTHALKAINQDFAKRNWPAIDMGIGLNSGTMNVGNMGSEYRVAYTVLGDAVNLGSRLEGLSKAYGVRIVVSEFTCKSIDGFTFQELDRVRVKGKEEPVTIYQPIGESASLSEGLKKELAIYAQMLKQYRQQQWDSADQLIKQLLGLQPNSKLYQLYLQRIHQYRTAPPPAQWDGVYTFETK